jgi:hypothetical protein
MTSAGRAFVREWHWIKQAADPTSLIRQIEQEASRAVLDIPAAAIAEFQANEKRTLELARVTEVTIVDGGASADVLKDTPA